MSGSSEEDIGDDGLQIKPPQHHRHRNRDDRQRRWAADEQHKSQSHRMEGDARGGFGDLRRREYYDRDRGYPSRNQRQPDTLEGSRERRPPVLERHRKRRHEEFGEGSQRRGNAGESSAHRTQATDMTRRSDSDQLRGGRDPDPDDRRSRQLHKSVKQKRKHLEQEEERAMREIEKRNRREQRNEREKASGSDKRRRKHDSSPSHQSPSVSPSHRDSDHELEDNNKAVGHPSKDSEELADAFVVEEIIHSSPEMEDEDSNKRYEEQRPYHSDVSSGDEDRRSGDEDDHKNSSPKSANEGSHSSKSKSGSGSDDSSDSSKSSDDESDNDGDDGDEKKNGVNPSSALAKEDEKTGTKASADIEVLDIEKSSSTPQVDESLLTDVDRAIREVNLLPPYFPAVQGCRRVEEFSLLNRIEEGTYGVVYRAKDRRTNEVVALKRLKMEKEKDGFPITSLREINTLLKAQHENIVTVREIVVGSNTDKIFLVMDYVEHDLKALMETLKQKSQKFLVEEVKCLMIQLLRAVAHLHDNWILHRDLKTSNLLLSHKGILKVGDFGLAREYGSPLKAYTPIVVTLWYRAPELLLGMKEYSIPIDVWSVGCIFGELVKMEPTFPGKSEANQLNLIFQTLGTPNDRIWPGYSQLPLLQKMTFVEQPMNKLKTRFGIIGDKGIDLMNKLLTYNPAKRISAEDALNHSFFKESPLPIDPSVFPTWPAKSELGHRKAPSSPKPPSGGRQFKDLRDDDDSSAGFFLGTSAGDRRGLPMGAGFSLKF